MEGNKPDKVLNRYSEMFDVEQVQECGIEPLGLIGESMEIFTGPRTRKVVTKKCKYVKGKKNLIKGKSGVGKSSLSKKITQDWARGIFKVFSLMSV